ncbi:MAG TPA: lamin tail domain-containing protein, partial [Opitutus sp.]|nr:lamin tail domain-containing protein [Opitutus sp.]
MFTSIPCSARVRFLLGLVCICVGPPCHLVAAPVINEFVASNSFGLKDEDGDYSDWIEVFNPDVAAVNLEGWAITDTASNKTKWRFPSVSIAPGEYLVVSASGKNRATAGTPLHTSFKLGAGGDYLALVQADGVTVASEYSPEYPAQITDVSYGWTQPTDVSETAIRSYLSPATPGARNGSAFSPPLKETVNFSRDSGPFTSVFELVLGGADDGQVIRYVMATPSAEDGSNPGAPTSSSFEYTGPLSIDSSVIVRAAVFTADGARSGGVTTAHYLQLDPGADFISQLPILVLDNHGFGNLVVGASKKPAWMHLFVPDGSGVSRLDGAPALSSPVNTKIRGFSSAQFPKKSY